MSTAGPVDVVVDTAELDRARADLQTVVGQMQDLDQRPTGTSAEELGGEGVADAVARFLDDWSDERHGLQTQLQSCMHLIEEAIQAYEDEERCLSGASVPSAEPAPESRP